MMRILITGGAGFIGSNLCRDLVTRHGSRVQPVVLDDYSTGVRENLPQESNLEIVRGSILDPACLDKVTRGVEAVVHLAARPSVPKSIADPMLSHHVNVTGTLEVLEACRRNEVARVIIASSSSVYGSNASIPKIETMTPAPISPYAASKLAVESYAAAYAASFAMRPLVFRFFYVFGPRQSVDSAYAAVIPAFIHAALRGAPVVIQGDGSQSRDFTFVGSVVDVIEQALFHNVSCSGPVNLAFGANITLLELVAELENILGHELERTYVERRAGDVDHSQADDSRLRALMPAIDETPFADGLRTTVEWYRSAYSP